MKIFVKKSICFLIFLHIITLTTFKIPIIADAKEKTGEQMVEEIIKELDLSDASYYDKVIVCGNWIANNISYDYEGLDKGNENRTVQETMKDRTGVCEGYARVFKEFMDQIGVPCMYIHDYKMVHAYNIVLMNDYKWYLVEPQTGLAGDRERDFYEARIKETKESINSLELDLNIYNNVEDREYVYQEIADTEEEIKAQEQELRVYEEKLRLLNGKGHFIIDSGYDDNGFLNGSNDFENNTIAPGRGYYKFVELSSKKIHAYPVATTKLRTDPDTNQKKFINKSSVNFTKKNITINAATCKAKVKLPLELENYTSSDLIFELKNIKSYDLDQIPIEMDFSYYDFILEDGKNINVKKQLDLSTLSFRLTAKTIYGNESTTNITLKYPQLTPKIIRYLYNGLEVGEKQKLKFTNNTTVKDFNIYIDKGGLKYVEYNSKTGEVKGKKSGFTKLWIKSKTNKNYNLCYYITVK